MVWTYHFQLFAGSCYLELVRQAYRLDVLINKPTSFQVNVPTRINVILKQDNEIASRLLNSKFEKKTKTTIYEFYQMRVEAIKMLTL